LLFVCCFNLNKIVLKTGVFEKAKQFVCRVFGGSNNDELPTKRSITEVDSCEQKKFRSIESDLQFQPISLSTSQSYTSIITKSPPPSPITRQSSMSFNVNESSLTQINTILDNIDSVLDKIETNINILEHHLNLNDGSGDTTLDFLDLIEESSSDESEEI
jgi:hypothetical protein